MRVPSARARLFARVCLLTVLSALSAAAQRADWGGLPPKHTALAVYEADTSAAAVVLFDVGEARVNDRFEIELERHRRVKLFREAGYEQATVALSIYTEDRTQRVSGIKGQTFVPDGQGGYRRVKMDGDAIFREDVGDDRERITFTLPALEPGAIVEFRYRLNSKTPIFFPTWYFQDDVPVLHSEFEATIPRELNYVQAKQGYLPFEAEEQERVSNFDGEANRYRWVRTDVPALREEPFMTTLEDHIHKIEFQLAEVLIPGYGIEKVLNTWEQLAEDLDGHSGFGRKLRSSRILRRKVDELTAGVTDPTARMQAIYDFVRTSIRSSGERGFIADERLGDVLEARAGSAPEVNLLLLQMLREADVEAQPVLLATRDYGRVQTIYPLINQFNYVIVLATVGAYSFWLDATNPVRPLGMLPASTLSGVGWVPREGNPGWVRIAPPATSATRSYTMDVRLDAAGTLAADARLNAEGYDAVWMRRAIEEDGPDVFVRDRLLDDLPGAVLDSARVEGLDTIGEPLKVYASFHVEGYAQTAGDLLFFNPAVLNRHVENPFKAPERHFPVEFNYPRTRRTTAQVHLPEGYAVDEMPEPLRLGFGDRQGAYQRHLAEQGGRLLVRTDTQVSDVPVEPNQYAELRAFYDRLVAADEQMVVLTRATAPAAELPTEDADPDAEASEAEVSEAEASETEGN